jgi:hypothetical protein
MVGKIDNMIEEKVQKTQDEFLSAGVQNKGNTKSSSKRKGLEAEEVKQSNKYHQRKRQICCRPPVLQHPFKAS